MSNESSDIVCLGPEDSISQVNDYSEAKGINLFHREANRFDSLLNNSTRLDKLVLVVRGAVRLVSGKVFQVFEEGDIFCVPVGNPLGLSVLDNETQFFMTEFVSVREDQTVQWHRKGDKPAKEAHGEGYTANRRFLPEQGLDVKVADFKPQAGAEWEYGVLSNPCDEVLRVAKGSIKALLADGREEDLSAGSTLYVPAGSKFGLENTGGDETEALCVFTPAADGTLPDNE